jgi:hypothetical protein
VDCGPQNIQTHNTVTIICGVHYIKDRLYKKSPLFGDVKENIKRELANIS